MKFDENNIPYRNTCKNCEYERYCPLEPNEKMFKRRCYVDYISDKMKITPQLLLNRCYKFMKKYGIDFYRVKNFSYIECAESSGKEKEEAIIEYLECFLQPKEPENRKVTRNEVKLFTAMLNTYLNCWRNEDYIHCARCGKLIKNSKQYNRRFCTDCIGYQKKEIDDGICIDCGESFYRTTNNQCRCSLCQTEANKIAARERARRYRERKNHDSDEKS